MRLVSTMVLLAGTILACRQIAAAQFIPLGDLFGGLVGSEAAAVNDGGNLVVGNSVSSRSVTVNEAFRWTDAGGMVPLGDLPGGAFASSAFDVSAAGTTIVGLGTTEAGNAATIIAGGVLNSLGDLPGGSISSAARGVSADGSTVVGSSSSAFGIEAFRWTSSEGMVGLGDLLGGGFFSSAAAISGDGGVIVGVSESASGDEAFRWTEAGGMAGLGDLPGGRFASEAISVTLDGTVIVGAGTTDLGPQAFRWTQAEGMVGLGWLPQGTTWSEAQSTSSDGSIVVGFSGVGDSQRAFLWSEEFGMESLQDVLSGRFDLAEELAGWRLTSANDISPNGQFIVGTGVNPNGDDEAWLARLSDFLRGDYNANGMVEQADLDLVLLNWGEGGFPPPAGWLSDLPIGPVDQQELDAVLINWGNRLTVSAEAVAIPEPPALALAVLALPFFVRRFAQMEEGKRKQGSGRA